MCCIAGVDLALKAGFELTHGPGHMLEARTPFDSQQTQVLEKPSLATAPPLPALDVTCKDRCAVLELSNSSGVSRLHNLFYMSELVHWTPHSH